MSLNETYELIKHVGTLQASPSGVPWWCRVLFDNSLTTPKGSSMPTVMFDQLVVSHRKATLFRDAEIAELHRKWLNFNTTLTELCITNHGIHAVFQVDQK